MVSKVQPFMMFQGEAQAALGLYAAQFPEARVEVTTRHGPGGPGVEGAVERATLTIAGQSIMVFDSPPVHAFSFTPAISFFIDCEDEGELDRLVAGLGEGGTVYMGPADYGFSRKFAWIGDRFGVSWQLNLP